MSLTIKNEGTLLLVRDLAEQLGVSQTTAITVAVTERLKQVTMGERRAEVMSALRDIWCSQPPDEAARLAANESALYDGNGLFA